MLMVHRSEHRPLESFAQTIMRSTVQRVAPQWITTPIDVLARAMYANSLIQDQPGTEILDNRAIFRLADQQRAGVEEHLTATHEL